MLPSADAIVFYGLFTALLGFVMFGSTRTRYFRASMAMRRTLLQQAIVHQDTVRTAKWTTELQAWEGRFPKYCLGLAGIGLVAAALGTFLLLHEGRLP